MTARGRLIVFEGGEGTGKSTQAALLAEHLSAECTREPGGTPLGERLRALVLDGGVGPVAPQAELLLLNAARAQHVAERLGPLLDAGRDVICDRYVGSTIAYQGYGRGLPLEDVVVACELATGGLEADFTILLDLPLEVAASRRRGAADDRIEAEADAFHRRVVEGFRAQAAADPQRWVRIDASGSIEEVAAAVRAAVAARFDAAAGAKRSDGNA